MRNLLLVTAAFASASVRPFFVTFCLIAKAIWIPNIVTRKPQNPILVIKPPTLEGRQSSSAFGGSAVGSFIPSGRRSQRGWKPEAWKGHSEHSLQTEKRKPEPRIRTARPLMCIVLLRGVVGRDIYGSRRDPCGPGHSASSSP